MAHNTGKLEGSPWIWKDGEFIRWEDANVHILSLAVQFAASVFEGVRCYETPNGPAVFRLHAHLRRLMASSRTYRMQPEHSVDELAEAVYATIRKNELNSCYVRPMVLRGYGAASMHPEQSPIETYIPLCGPGAPTWEKKGCPRVWMCACRPGTGRRRTPSPAGPRRPGTTSGRR